MHHKSIIPRGREPVSGLRHFQCDPSTSVAAGMRLSIPAAQIATLIKTLIKD
jgi:hypothetical protein